MNNFGKEKFPLHGLRKCTIVVDLSAENEKAELSVRQEDNEEHDGESGDVLGATAESQAQLGHGLVEAHVLEYLDPGEKDHERHGAVEHVLPVAQEVKVKVLLVVREQTLEQIVHFDLTIHVEYDANYGQHNDQYVQIVPECFEVVHFVFFDLLHRILVYETNKQTVQNIILTTNR